MKNTENKVATNAKEIKKNYASIIKGEAILGVRIELNSMDVLAMQQIIYEPLQRKQKAQQLLDNSGLNGWNTPEGMTKEEWKDNQDLYARNNGYDSWYALKEEARWNFSYIQQELETFFSKIKMENVNAIESTLFTPIVNEENE